MRAADELTRHLVTAGNFGFVANGTPLFKLVQKGNKFKKYYNVAPGQLVMWAGDQDCVTPPNTIAPANLTLAQLGHLKIGVGYSTENNGISDAIRLLTPGDLQGCTIKSLEAAGPQCATPWIKALYPSCVSCDTTTVRVRVSDSATLSFSDDPLKGFEEYVESYTPNCKSCEDCDKTVTCDEVVCGLVDALNGEINPTVDGTTPYPNWVEPELPRPFTAFKLHQTWKSYCISPEVGEGCTNCNAIEALTSFTVNGTEFDFELTNPSNALETLVDQLQIAVDLINEKFTSELGRHSGKAFIARGKGKCCALQLFVSTCDETFEIAGLTECEDAIEQFPDFVTTGYCQQCDTATTTETPSCGIGFFISPDTGYCDCLDIDRPKKYNYKWIEVDFISGSGNDNLPLYSKKATLLEGQVASGFGSEIQWLEYAFNIDAMGEEGFQYEIGNKPSGWLGLPEKRSRIRKAVTADCNKSYCSYRINARIQQEFGAAGTFTNKPLQGNIHVPTLDTTTKTAVNALYTKIAELVPAVCGDSVEAASC